MKLFSLVQSIFCVYLLKTQNVETLYNAFESPVCQQCHCVLNQHSKFTVDCSNKGFQEISKFIPESTAVLLLNHNRIHQIPNNTFHHLRKLQVLELGWNNIRQLDVDSFRGLKQLKELSLKHNSFSSSFPKGVFKAVGKLSSLDLASAGLNYISIDDSLQELKNLEYLKIPGTYQPLGQGFKWLKKLKVLDLSGTQMTHISNETFDTLQGSALEKLSLRSTGLYSIQKSAFSQMTKLKILDLSCNMWLGLQTLQTLVCGLQDSKIEGLLLDLVNNGDAFEVSLFDIPWWCLKNKNLRYLSLEMNSFTLNFDFTNPNHKHALHWLFNPNLEYFSVAWNRINMNIQRYVSTNLGKLLQLHKNIRLINFSYQRANRQFPDYKLEECNRPHEIFTHSRPLLFKDVDNKITTDKDVGSPSTIHESDPGIQTETFSLPSSLEFFLLDSFYIVTDQKLSYRITNFVNSNIRVISLANNAFKYALTSRILTGLERLEFVNLTNCQVESINQIFFKSMPNLLELILKDNKLTNISDQLFQYQINLKTLDLSFNKLRNIATNAFQYLQNVEHIYLIGNSIDSFNINLINLTNLQFLDLSRNQLPFLNIQTLQQFETINKLRNLTVDLSKNPFKCLCDFQNDVTNFLKWVQTTKVSLMNKKQYTCQFNDKIANLVDINIAEFTKKCETPSVHHYEKFISITTALVVFVCICFAFGYKFRWPLRYRWYIIKRRLQACLRGKNERENNNGHKDVYIAYSCDDTSEAFKMCKTLEETYEFTTYFEDRDFMVGDSIADNIIKALEQTNKTVILVTDTFLASGWCDFIFQMTIAMRSSFPVVVVLTNKPITIQGYENMSKTLRQFIRQGKYIEWAYNINNQEGFWVELQNCLEYTNNPTAL